MLSWFCLLVLWVFVSNQARNTHASEELYNGRYSFSLSVFDPKGQLGQVDRALQAAQLGTTIVAVVVDSGTGKGSDPRILMAAPQRLPSPLLMQDDGTSRFASLTSEIAVTHTGLSADGRVLVAAAQRLAIQHQYTFDEEIPIDILLEELSMFMQEYTQKPGTRPFGVILMIAYVPSDKTNGRISPQLFQVDPSGSVTGLGQVAVVNAHMSNGILNPSQLRQTLLELSKIDQENSIKGDDWKNQHDQIAAILTSALTEGASKQTLVQEDKLENQLPQTILSAMLSRDSGFSTERHPIQLQEEEL